jgi:hypothetical protein
MSDNIKFLLLIVLGIVGIYVGFVGVGGSFFGGGTALANVSASLSGGGSFLASAASVVNGVASQGTGKFLISFDNLTTVHTGVLSENDGTLRVYDVDIDTAVSPAVLYVATNQGLYTSYDTGFTWHGVKSLKGEINDRGAVLRVLPVGAHSFIVSVFQDGVGYVYYTPDAFFTVEEWAHFDNEGVYDMALYGDTLYLGMSNGQLISYDIHKKTLSVIHTFSSPITRLYGTEHSLAYVYLKSGALLRVGGNNEYVAVSVSKGLFSSSAIVQVAFDSRGTLYTLTKNGVYKSVDSGSTFSLLDTAPLLTKRIDAIGATGNSVYILSAGRLYMSVDGGVSWKLNDSIPADFSVAKMYFVGGGRVILSE